jgi:hypothetical protein
MRRHVQRRGVFAGRLLSRYEPTRQRRRPGRPPRGGTRQHVPPQGPSAVAHAAHTRGCPLVAPGRLLWPSPGWRIRADCGGAATKGRQLCKRRGETRSLRHLFLHPACLVLRRCFFCGCCPLLSCVYHCGGPGSDRYFQTGRFSKTFAVPDLEHSPSPGLSATAAHLPWMSEPWAPPTHIALAASCTPACLFELPALP